MIPVVSIVGKSGSGKTALIERLIAEFQRRGYRVAAVKHSPGGMDIDQPGKDSWSFAKAGSDIVVISSPDKLILIRNMDRDPRLEDILQIIGTEYDIVLAEGFKKDDAPKIEVYRKDIGDDLMCPVQVLSAIATDKILDIDVNQLPLYDTVAVADFIERKLILENEGDTLLSINGKQVFLSTFVKGVIANTLLAMVSTLKGVGKVKSLNISIRNRS